MGKVLVYDRKNDKESMTDFLQQILALAVCPRLPHILASGSRDDTIRIWNLFGHEAAQGPESKSENYAMADADEGNYIVAVLRGQWPGGHRDDVSALVRQTPWKLR